MIKIRRNNIVSRSGDTMTGNLILNDSISLLLGTGSDGELFHDGTNTYFQNNTGGMIIENDASDGDITFKVNDGGVDTTVMTIDGATGNVGIGTTGPLELLSLGTAGTTAGVLSLAGATSGKAIINVSAAAGTPTLTLPTSTGTIYATGGTDVAVADGGTGSSTAAGALTNLGLTATAAELNTLDGITPTVTELNYVDGVTSAIQTQITAKQGLNQGGITVLTIATGEVTLVENKSYYAIDTEGAAATDDLDYINGGSPGDIIILRAANNARDVVLIDSLVLRLAGNMTLDTLSDTITLMRLTSTVWVEISRSDNV